MTRPVPVYIFDAIRTPRSMGKADGSLHEIKPVNLVTGLLVEMQRRHDLDTSSRVPMGADGGPFSEDPMQTGSAMFV
jgi:hypothetical protein